MKAYHFQRLALCLPSLLFVTGCGGCRGPDDPLAGQLVDVTGTITVNGEIAESTVEYPKHVTLVAADGTESYINPCASDGSFEIPAVAPGQYWIALADPSETIDPAPGETAKKGKPVTIKESNKGGTQSLGVIDLGRP